MAWCKATNLVGLEYAFTGTECFSNAYFIFRTSSRGKKETAGRKALLGTLHIADGSSCGDLDYRGMLQAQFAIRFGSRHVPREFLVASSNPFGQRFPSNPTFCAGLTCSHVQEYAVKSTLMD